MIDDDFEVCSKCLEDFDSALHELFQCPRCGEEGSSACCNPGGLFTICLDCNAEDGADDVGKGVDDE